MDPLDDVFAAMRVRTAVHARLEAAAPWGIRFAPGETARFGLVVTGEAWLACASASPVRLVAGDCYVVVRGAGYSLRDAATSATRDCFEVIGDRAGGTIPIGGSGASATVITGWFTFDELGARPLMQLMPDLIRAHMDDDRRHILQAALQLLALETEDPALGSGVMVSRLADILFIQTIRTHAATAEPSETGWLAALGDRRLAPAFRALHAACERPWTVAALAAQAGMSRSAFAAHFKARVGEAPLEYVTRWRMFRAAALLRQTDRALAEVAAGVGYESEAAFGKAFKRMTGLAPGAFRRADSVDPLAVALARKPDVARAA